MTLKLKYCFSHDYEIKTWEETILTFLICLLINWESKHMSMMKKRQPQSPNIMWHRMVQQFITGV